MGDNVMMASPRARAKVVRARARKAALVRARQQQ
jgi:hypothetical protein